MRRTWAWQICAPSGGHVTGNTTGADRASLGRIYLQLFATTLLWGGGAVAGKLVLRGSSNFAVGILRFGLAGLTLVTLSL